MSRYGDPVLGDEAAHDRRCEAALTLYEEREANAPADLYEDEARAMIIEALTGGKDDIDITGCLVHRFEKDCTKLGAFDPDIPYDGWLIVADPDHLVRQIQWTVQDLIKDWVAHRVRDYAEDE